MPPLPVPSPVRERWQPLRSGVLNLYRYDEEEFHYADGRLLLRGNNGSGKSRVLALQLPFLLDGEVTPARVEPDGDAAKRVSIEPPTEPDPGAKRRSPSRCRVLPPPPRTTAVPPSPPLVW